MIKDLLKKLFPEKAEELDKLDVENEKANETAEVEELKNLAKAQQAEIKKLVAELEEVKRKELETQKFLEEKAKRERQELIENILKKAIEENKIPAKNELLIQKYRTMLEKDLETGKIIIENIPSRNNFSENKKEFEFHANEKAPKGNNILKAIIERNSLNN